MFVPKLRVAAFTLLASALLTPSAAVALTLDDLNSGASLSSADGRLTFENWSVTTPDPFDASPNSFLGLDLSLFEVELTLDGVLLKVLETDGPLVAFGGQVGNLNIRFDAVTDSATRIEGVGLGLTGTAQGAGAVAMIEESVVGSQAIDLLAFRIGGGAQSPTDFALFSTPQTLVSVEKLITLDTRAPGALVAQISEFEQSFQVSVIPEPTAMALFSVGAFVVLASLRRRTVV